MAIIHPKASIYAIILLISLGMNLFLGGLFIGLWWFKPPPPHDNVIPRNPFEVMRAVPEAREKIQPIIHRHAPDVRPKMQQLRQARRAIRQQLRQPKIDLDVLRTSLATLRQAELTMRTASHEAFLEVLNELTPTQRQKLMARHNQHQHHRPPHRRLLERLPQRDHDGDGNVSRAEFFDGMSDKRRERLHDLFERLDTNQNDRLDVGEIRAAVPAP